jgi:hypothetical protein
VHRADLDTDSARLYVVKHRLSPLPLLGDSKILPFFLCAGIQQSLSSTRRCSEGSWLVTNCGRIFKEQD